MKQDYTHLILVLDKSGSMSHLQDATIEGVNALVAAQQKQPGTLTTAVYMFNHVVSEVDHFTKLDRLNYVPAGSTALFDAICIAIAKEGERLAAKAEDERPDKVIVVVDTDGENNASVTFKLEDVKRVVELQQTQYNWQLVFLGANIDAFSVGGSTGFVGLSTMQYDPTANGVFVKYASVTASMSSYRSGEAASVDLTNKTT